MDIDKKDFQSWLDSQIVKSRLIMIKENCLEAKKKHDNETEVWNAKNWFRLFVKTTEKEMLSLQFKRTDFFSVNPLAEQRDTV